jgi:hypothetical protein
MGPKNLLVYSNAQISIDGSNSMNELMGVRACGERIDRQPTRRGYVRCTAGVCMADRSIDNSIGVHLSLLHEVAAFITLHGIRHKG